MAGIGGQLDGGRELSELEQKSPSLGRLVRRVIDGVNTLARNTSASPTGEPAAPAPPASVTVTTAGEYAHLTVSHPAAVDRGINYITTIQSDDPATTGRPMILDHHSSRTPPPFPLPSFRPNPDDPESPIRLTYTASTVAQYKNSPPSASVSARHTSGVFTFQMDGTTQMSLLPGNGSGSGPNTGLGGQGLGKVQQRT